MEWDVNKKIVLDNIQILLNNMGKSHKWLNIKIFGLNTKGEPCNFLWRKDQKSLNSEVINSIAKVFNRSVDEIVSIPLEKPKSSPGSMFVHAYTPIYDYNFQNKKNARECIEILGEMERLDAELFKHAKMCLQMLLDGANIMVKKTKRHG